MADNYGQMFGNLPPKQSRSFAKTPLQGLKEIFPNLQYKPVCHEQTKCTELRKEKVQQLTKSKDLIIAALGTGQLAVESTIAFHTWAVVDASHSLLQLIYGLKLKATHFDANCIILSRNQTA